MLEKNKINELLKNKEYEKITNILRIEYRNIVENYLVKNSITFKPNTTFLDILAILGIHFPEYKGIVDLLTEGFYNEEMSDENRIINLVDSYDDIVTVLT